MCLCFFSFFSHGEKVTLFRVKRKEIFLSQIVYYSYLKKTILFNEKLRKFIIFISMKASYCFSFSNFNWF